ncbi:hypothetical protein [Streptomyces collinus]|uniref:hypothetical protein n=1 Tax=Streptomyces collinus TaxID=42684 RepID=UPI00331B2358
MDAVKMTVKGGIGKLQEKARGGGWKPGQPWPALARPTWRPDIRATVISRARINMRRSNRPESASGSVPEESTSHDHCEGAPGGRGDRAPVTTTSSARKSGLLTRSPLLTAPKQGPLGRFGEVRGPGGGLLGAQLVQGVA